MWAAELVFFPGGGPWSPWSNTLDHRAGAAIPFLISVSLRSFLWWGDVVVLHTSFPAVLRARQRRVLYVQRARAGPYLQFLLVCWPRRAGCPCRQETTTSVSKFLVKLMTDSLPDDDRPKSSAACYSPQGAFDRFT